MKLTSTILKNIYNMLVVCEPFDKWDMPLAEQIKFIVDYDPDTMGTYLYDDGQTSMNTLLQYQQLEMAFRNSYQNDGA